MELPHDWQQVLADKFQFQWVIKTGRSITSEFPLYYVVELSKVRPYLRKTIKNTYKMRMYVPFPDDYPATRMNQIDDSEMFKLDMTFDTDKDTVYLSGFVNHAHIYADVATKDEVAGLKGIGSEALCVIFDFMVDYRLLTRNGYITLLAVASSVMCKTTDIHKQLTHLSTTQIIDTYVKPHPKSYAEYLSDPAVLDNLMCRIIQERKLVAYYQTLGFTIKDSSSGTAVDMDAHVQDILDKCSQQKQQPQSMTLQVTASKISTPNLYRFH
jgi:hypothetical protein